MARDLLNYELCNMNERGRIHNKDVSNHTKNDSFEQVLHRRLARRSFLKGATAAAGFFVINGANLPDDT